MNEQKTLTTTYRRLENVLYIMGITPLKTGKEWDGSTYWVYADTPEVRLIASTLKTLEAQIKELKEARA